MQTQTQTQQDARIYKTADLYLGAYFSVAGVPIEEMVKKGRQVTMHFRDEGQIEELRQQYYNRKAKVGALAFTQEIQMLKKQIAEILSQD